MSRNSFFSENAADIHERVDRELHTMTTDFLSPVEKVAVACRILAERGHARSLAGQITLRDAEGETFWTTRFDLAFAEAKATNLVRVDSDMAVVQGAGMPNPAVRFHLWIYDARPDINCIIHTHPPFCSALSMIGEELAVAHMDATMFYADCAYLAQWPGVPLANEEGRIISEALGSKRSILLAHHGLLTTGKSLEEALYLAVSFEQAAQMHLTARAAGPIRPIDPARAGEAHDFMVKDSLMGLTFNSWARQLLEREPDAIGDAGAA